MDERLKKALGMPVDNALKGTGQKNCITNTGKGEQTQRKTAWDGYFDQQLADLTVCQAFEEEETKVQARLSLITEPQNALHAAFVTNRETAD